MKFVVMLLVLIVVVVGILYGLDVLGPGADALTIRVAVDISHSEPVLEKFMEDTGIKLDIHYDEEASKTIGHVMTILEEQKTGNTRCDVFWNNEIVHTLRMKQLGYTLPYESPSAKDIPPEFKDAEHHWAGFGARARIFIVNTSLMPDPDKRPTSYADLANPEFAGKGTFALPETGTTLTHVAALFNEDILGLEGVRKFLAGCNENRVNWAASNGQTMAQVRDGQMHFGFTDTDDYNLALKKENATITAVYPDQGEGQIGTMVIPNTICMLKGCSHPEEAKKLIDYILSKEVEEALAFGLSRQIPVRPDVKTPEGILVPGRDFRAMKVDWEKVATEYDQRRDEAKKILNQR